MWLELALAALSGGGVSAVLIALVKRSEKQDASSERSMTRFHDDLLNRIKILEDRWDEAQEEMQLLHAHVADCEARARHQQVQLDAMQKKVSEPPPRKGN